VSNYLGTFDWPTPSWQMSDFESIQKKANWIRLTLLEKYGGVWVDASSFAVSGLDTLMVGADRDERLTVFSTRQNDAVATNWFIAAPMAGNPVVKAWRQKVRAGAVPPTPDLAPRITVLPARFARRTW
jgi:hypothetical protein